MSDFTHPDLPLNCGEVTRIQIVEADQVSMNESNVCVGDIYLIGTVKMQVTRPRKPCWKIDAQLNSRGIAKFLLGEGCIGW